MKRAFFLFLLSINFVCNSFTQDNNIWGVWNADDRNAPRTNMYKYIDIDIDRNKDSCFLITNNAFIFENYYYSIARKGYPSHGTIRMNPDNYNIIKIIQNEGNIVSLYIEACLLSESGFRGTDLWVNAKIVLHFIDQNHMWMEIDREDEQYPTDKRYKDRPFEDTLPYFQWFDKGPSLVFWRERVEMDGKNKTIPSFYDGRMYAGYADEESETMSSVFDEHIIAGEEINMDVSDAGNTDSEAMPFDKEDIAKNNRKKFTLLFFLLAIPLVIFGLFLYNKKRR